MKTAYPGRVRLHALPSWFPLFGGGTLGTRSHIWVKASLDPRTRQAIVAHELVHLEQARRTSWWLLRYLFSRSFRFAAESEAYSESVRSGVSLYVCARRLASSYLLGITLDQAVVAISLYLHQTLSTSTSVSGCEGGRPPTHRGSGDLLKR